MTNWQAATLCILTIGGVGIILILLGFLFSARQKKKINDCTGITPGYVINYCFRGEGRMFPVIEYQVAEKKYKVNRRFRGYIFKNKVAPGKIYENNGAYVTPEDYLYVPMSAITNLKSMAKNLWPIGSKMNVYYNPAHPETAYAEKKPTKKPLETTIFIWTGFGMVVLSIIAALLIML